MLRWLEENKLEAKFLLRDRDSKFSFAFDRLLFGAGLRRVRAPLLAPDANAFAESWIGSFKRECLDHFACFSLGHLDHIGQEYVRFLNRHRPHQGLGNLTIEAAASRSRGDPQFEETRDVGSLTCRQFLGGLLRHYSREAA